MSVEKPLKWRLSSMNDPKLTLRIMEELVYQAECWDASDDAYKSPFDWLTLIMHQASTDITLPNAKPASRVSPVVIEEQRLDREKYRRLLIQIMALAYNAMKYAGVPEKFRDVRVTPKGGEPVPSTLEEMWKELFGKVLDLDESWRC
jgi:hypothetical protein